MALQQTSLGELDNQPVNAGSPPSDVGLPAKPVFISYARKNIEFARRLARDLEARGVTIWIDLENLKLGTRDWEESLRTAIHGSRGVLLIASEESRQSTAVRDELALADAEGKPIYPVWALGEVWINSVPLSRGSMQYIDARGAAYETALTEVVEVLAGRSELAHQGPPTTESFPDRNPFKGLRPFRPEDQDDFFGREALVNDLVSALDRLGRDARLMAVVGPSGSGKSSVVMAGLLPALQEGALEDSATWIYPEPMVPGAHPLENLTVTLARFLPERSQASIREDLDVQMPRGLHRLAQQIGGSRPTRMVLVIDQLEELFTLTKDEAERQQFIDLITTASMEPDGFVAVILTLRADFYDRPMAYAVLGALISANTQPVLPMSLADLQATIQKPAAHAGLRFEDGLVSELIFGVRDRESALPLLQFTLDQLYQRRDGRRLTMAAYRELGGIQGALARHAQAIYDDLPTVEHQRSAQALFLRLIKPDTPGQEATRRRAALQELDLSDVRQTAVLREVAETYIDQRLLTTNRIGEVETIEIGHEALIREWGLLKTWLNEAQNDIRFRRKLSEDISAWHERDETPEMLYRGKLLLEAEAWAARNAINCDEARFIQISLQQRDREAQQQVEQALREQKAVFQRMLLSLAERYLGAALGAGIVFALLGFSAYGRFSFESDQVYHANRLRNTLALGIQYGILMGVPLLVALELPARLRTLPRAGRIGLGWLGSAVLTGLVFGLLYLNKLVNGDLRSSTLVVAPLLFSAGFALSAGMRRTGVRWLVSMAGVFLSLWPFDQGTSDSLLKGFFADYPGQWYMLRLSVFAAFTIGSFPFLPELVRSLVISVRRPVFNK